MDDSDKQFFIYVGFLFQILGIKADGKRSKRHNLYFLSIKSPVRLFDLRGVNILLKVSGCLPSTNLCINIVL